jgi:hypothetical protein
MKLEQQHTYEKIILGLELLGFAMVIAVLWLDEFVDVPYRYLGAKATPLRPQEFWFEALTVLLVGVGVVVATIWNFRRLRFLEGLVQICAWCRRVNVGDEWVSVEQYLTLEHDLQSTHGICPNCRSDPAARKRRTEKTLASVVT